MLEKSPKRNQYNTQIKMMGVNEHLPKIHQGDLRGLYIHEICI